jgi:hypothetical protein
MNSWWNAWQENKLKSSLGTYLSVANQAIHKDKLIGRWFGIGTQDGDAVKLQGAQLPKLFCLDAIVG